jgi:mannose-6-phosphate isomerase-like protein (cupin superfamily)
MSPPPFTRLPLAFDVEPMLGELGAVADAQWVAHFNDGCHDGAWRGLALRAPGGDPANLYANPQGADSIRDTAMLAGFPHVAAALGRIECPLRSVRLLRLEAGGVIREHRDADLRFEEGEARLHIPLATNPGVEFYVDGVRVVMEPGECWYLDLSRPHRVHNRGSTERVHLVVDCRVNAWLRSQLARGVPLARPAGEPSGQEAFAALREQVLEDEDLQAQLRALPDAGQLAAKAVQLGAARGFHFSDEEVRAAMTRGRQAWYSQWVF